MWLQLVELLERKTELEMLVMAIEQNLRRSGYDFRKNDYVSPSLQPGIRINGELSFRGKKKARELFNRLDEENKGVLYYEDFRGEIFLTYLYVLKKLLIKLMIVQSHALFELPLWISS